MVKFGPLIRDNGARGAQACRKDRRLEKLPVETTLYSLSDDPPAPEQRREDDRHLTLFRVGSMIIDGRRDLCLIKNISAGGMNIRAYSPVFAGAAVSIELKCGQPVAGHAVWVEGSNAGIEFEEKIDVINLLSTSMKGPRPRMPRIETQVLVTVRQGANVYRVPAGDISQGGIKLRSETCFTAGADVVVSLAGLGANPGVVRWCEGGHTGIIFNRLLPLAALVDWLQEQRLLLLEAG